MFLLSFALNSSGSMSIVLCSFLTILKGNILRFYEKFERQIGYSKRMTLVWLKTILGENLPSPVHCTVKRPSHILLTKVQMWHGPELNLHGHFQQPNAADKIHQIHDGCLLRCKPHVPRKHYICVEIEQLSLIVETGPRFESWTWQKKSNNS